MTSTSKTPFINTPTSSEAPGPRSKSPGIITRLKQTYPLVNQAIQSEEHYQAVSVAHLPQSFNELVGFSDAHLDSETTIEELRNSLTDLSHKAQNYETQYGELLSRKHDIEQAHVQQLREKDAIISALQTRPSEGGSQTAQRTPPHPDIEA